MKKVLYFVITLVACVISLNACDKEQGNGGTGIKVAQTKVVAAVFDFYTTWEKQRIIPEKVAINGEEYTIGQFIAAEAEALVSVAGGKSGEIEIMDYTATFNSETDSYDQEVIAVEDLVTIASSLLKQAAKTREIPKESVIHLGKTAITYSTERATVTIARALAGYAKTGRLPETVDTDYLPAPTNLKAFAEQFVTYLDVWENTIADVLSADGSACEDNENAWKNVHFIPIPQDTKNEWENQGSQYDPKYQPYHTIEIGGTTYTAAQCWEIAIRGLLNLCTTQGEEFLNTMDRNTPIPYGNGMSLIAAPISRPSDDCIWGQYPWYENKDYGGTVKYNGQPLEQVGLEFIMKCTSWHVTRSFITNNHNTPFGRIGNYQQFGGGTLNLKGYEGLICPMREFLILARFYKYMLDHDINTHVYDALKDVKVDFELY